MSLVLLSTVFGAAATLVAATLQSVLLRASKHKRALAEPKERVELRSRDHHVDVDLSTISAVRLDQLTYQLETKDAGEMSRAPDGEQDDQGGVELRIVRPLKEAAVGSQYFLGSETTQSSIYVSPRDLAELVQPAKDSSHSKKDSSRSRWVVPLVAGVLASAGPALGAYVLGSKPPDCAQYAQVLLNLSQKVKGQPSTLFGPHGLKMGSYQSHCGDPASILNRLNAP